MSKTPMHPDEENLLRFADGELAARRAAEVRTHLESCWECRAALAELQGVIGRCVRYRKQVGESVPAPPGPWIDIRQRFAAMDAEPVPVSDRLLRLLRTPVRAVPRWAPMAAALAVVAVAIYQLRETPSVQAAALLRKAVAASEAGAEAPRRIRIRTARRQVTRTLGGVQPAAAQADLAGIAAMFKAARYDWDNPLSARSFQQWRDGLADRRDEVTAGAESYRIRTSTGNGELAAASLTLRRGDLRPTETRLDFRDREWVELTEAPAEAEPRAELAASLGPPPAAATAPPATHAATALPRRATPEEELKVLDALHRLGADLGDPIEVSRTGSRVLVSGIGVAAARRLEVEHALEGLSNVDVRFADPAPATLSPPSVAETAAGAGQGPVQARLEQQAGGRPGFERLATQLLEASDAAMARAYALRRLAQKFPPEEEAGLGPEGRRVLGKLNQEYATALFEQSVSMERLIGPLLEAMGGSTHGGRAPEPDNWQSAAEYAFTACRRVESLLAATLGMSASGTAADELPSELLGALARLKAAAQASNRLVPLEVRR